MNKSTGTFKLVPHHCGISVPDIEASIAWYQDMLGFSVAKRMTLGEAKAKIAFLKHGEFYIELFEVEGAAPLPEDRRHPQRDILTHGIKHITFLLEDVPGVMDTLKQRGVDVAMDVHDVEGKPMAFIRDNAGNLIELVSAGAP